MCVRSESAIGALLKYFMSSMQCNINMENEVIGKGGKEVTLECRKAWKY